MGTNAPRVSGLTKLLAFGSGIGIEIAGRDMKVTAARMRPGGIEVLAEMRVQNFEDRPATEWGSEIIRFARELGLAHIPAVLLLPRELATVRTLTLPGVADKDMAAAVSFQADSLHPYEEAEAAHCWARLGKTAHVLVGITTNTTLNRFVALFAEAGVKLASVTVPAAAFHSAVRLYNRPPAEGFLAVLPAGDALEVYGESAARPLLSGLFTNGNVERALAMAKSDLRLESTVEPVPLERLMPPPVRAPEGFDARESARTLAAAVASAKPGFALTANFLPDASRAGNSRLMYAPTLLLLLLVGVAALLLASQESYEDKKYRERLNTEIAAFEKRVRQVERLDRDAAGQRARVELLDGFRKRSAADGDALRELTTLIAPPGWVQGLTLSRGQVTVQGEVDQAAALLKVIDGSEMFRNSEISQITGRSASGAETFVIRASREGEGTGEEPAAEARQ